MLKRTRIKMSLLFFSILFLFIAGCHWEYTTYGDEYDRWPIKPGPSSCWEDIYEG